MKILPILLFVACFVVAEEVATNNATSAAQENASANAAEQKAETNPDEKLKNDIITFDRIDYIQDNASISDPFIYVYPQSEKDLIYTQNVINAVLVLNGVFEDKDNNSIKASINNQWVMKGDTVAGWKVSNIQLDKVELEFRNNKKELYVYPKNNNMKIN